MDGAYTPASVPGSSSATNQLRGTGKLLPPQRCSFQLQRWHQVNTSPCNAPVCFTGIQAGGGCTQEMPTFPLSSHTLLPSIPCGRQSGTPLVDAGFYLYFLPHCT